MTLPEGGWTLAAARDGGCAGLAGRRQRPGLRKGGSGIQADETAAGDPGPERRRGARASGPWPPRPLSADRGPAPAALSPRATTFPGVRGWGDPTHLHPSFPNIYKAPTAEGEMENK